MPWWALALAFAGAEVFAVHVRVRRSSHTFTLGEIPLVLGLAFARPADLLIGITLGSLLVLLRNREQTPAKIVFNVGQLALGAVLALVAFHALLPAGPATSPSAWLALLAGAVASALIGSVLVSVAILLTSSAVPLAKLAPVFGLSLAVCMINSALALCAVGAIAVEPAAGLLLLAPAGAMVMAYRQSMAERRKRERLELMHDVTALLARRDDLSAGLEGLLERTLDAFHGDYASVVLVPAEERARRRSSGSRWAAGPPRSARPTSSWRAPCTRRRAATATRCSWSARSPTRPRRRARPRGARWAMLATLRGEKRTLGTFLLAGRASPARTCACSRPWPTTPRHGWSRIAWSTSSRACVSCRPVSSTRRFHDPLTGLANRALFLDRLDDALARAGAATTRVLFLDLDDFKTVNDRLGHAAGDELLVAVARAAARGACARPTWPPGWAATSSPCCSRTSTTVDDGDAVAERMLGRCSAPFAVAGHELLDRAPASASSPAGRPASSADELLRNADVAMYAAKAARQGPLRGLRAAHARRGRRRHRLEEDLAARGRARRAASSHYQPIVALDDGRIVAARGARALAAPRARAACCRSEFIPLAEETGSIVELGRWVLQRGLPRRATGSWSATSAA